MSAANLEINVAHEISLGDGSYIAKEHEGSGRFALITHNHGRFEGGDVIAAECFGGYLVSQLPIKYSKIKATLLPHDYVLTECKELHSSKLVDK